MDDGMIYGGGIMATAVGLLKWSLGRNISAHDKAITGLQRDVAESKAELAKHQLDVANNYAKTATVERVHERIDAVQKDTQRILELMVGKK